METWVQMISSVGFPIASAVAMFYLVFKLITPLKTAVDNNTKAINDLKDELKGIKHNES